jgi:hypothetical protein
MEYCYRLRILIQKGRRTGYIFRAWLRVVIRRWGADRAIRGFEVLIGMGQLYLWGERKVPVSGMESEGDRMCVLWSESPNFRMIAILRCVS